MAIKGERNGNFFNEQKKDVLPYVLERLVIKHMDRGFIPHYEHKEYDSVIAIMQEA